MGDLPFDGSSGYEQVRSPWSPPGPSLAWPCGLRTRFPGPSRGSLLEPVWRFDLPLRARRNVRAGAGRPQRACPRTCWCTRPNVIPEVRGRCGRVCGYTRRGGAAHGPSARPSRRRHRIAGPGRSATSTTAGSPPSSDRSGPSRTSCNGRWLGHPAPSAPRRTSRSALLLATVVLDLVGQRAAADVALVLTILFSAARGASPAPPTTPTPTGRRGPARPLHSTLMVVGLVRPRRVARAPRRRTRPTGRSRSRCRSSGSSSSPRAPSSAATSSTSSATWSAGTRSAAPARSGSSSTRATSPTSRRSPRRRPRRAKAGINDLVLVRIGDTVHAMHAVCAHAGGPLAKGTVVDGCLECPWHGSRFRLTDGHVVARSGRLRPAGLRDPGGRGRRLRGPTRGVLTGPASSLGVDHRAPGPVPRRPDRRGRRRASRRSRHASSRPDEILSSDAFRARRRRAMRPTSAPRGPPSSGSIATSRPRLRAGRLTVVDATNLERSARRRGSPAPAPPACRSVAIVLDLPADVVLARNAARLERVVDPAVVRRHLAAVRPRLSTTGGWRPKGSTPWSILETPEAVDSLRIERRRA